MKKTHIKSVYALFFILCTVIAFSQVKQITPPNIKSPFQSKSKKVLGNKSVITPTSATAKTSKPSMEKLKTVNGSFFLDFKNSNNSQTSRKKESRTSKIISNEFGSWFGLNQDHSFKLISEKEDELKITHSYYQQYYKGFLVEGSILMLHAKDGIVEAANGQVAEFASMETQIVISTDEAKNIAKSFLKVTNLINEYPVETLIYKVNSEKGADFVFALKVRIDSNNPFTISNVYVDAINGTVIDNISLLNDIDTPANATTMYSGMQSITSDSSGGSYRLRDNSRKIETYNATNATSMSSSGFNGVSDFTNATTTWNGMPRLKSFTIATISQNWWFTPLIDELPDLYIKVKNSLGQIVYTSGIQNNTNPSVTFDNLNILLTDSPYTIELWDYDTVGGDDFGGSYIVSNVIGNNIWSENGNTGNYVINLLGNPATDVHWGMEKTFDFYLNTFGRNSFDGNGSLIKNYLNPSPTVIQTAFNDTAGLPNNAFAAPSPYNFMVYGMGDGTTMNPLVGLDVEGHEYSHMVVANRNVVLGGLNYLGESGALNESFADIFGTCVEFYAKPSTANWNIGEDVMLPAGSFLRSMSNPNLKQQPDTYKSPNGYWQNPNCGTPTSANDKCGVHTNSGVQNYWFYLLSQGGSGTNDLGNVFSVNGIGINKSRQIAYLNLTTYLGGKNSTYMDSYNGSLLAAQALYGNQSIEYTAVRQAWYAVGIGNDPNSSCSGNTNLTASTGTFSDGSGSANYNNNASCKWVIAPAGATQISLNFTEFNTEENIDKVYVYDGADDTAPLLASWWGNTLPPNITTTAGVGAMCVKFTSDASTTFGGWTANYNATITTPSCNGLTLLTSPNGTFSDGSVESNYTNNQQCFWYIAPPCATSVTLSFSQFDTELTYDGIAVYDSLEATNLIGFYSGTTLPASITSATGIMLVLFISDYTNVLQGFTANYISTGSSYCSGVTTLNTSDYGTITDGSGANNYCNNSNCSWLIQPPQATSVTFNFTQFELESASTDGNSVYDVVEIFDGTSASAPLLGRFTGSNIPASITSSGGSMFVHFYSDVASNYQGWSGYYTSTQNGYCNASAGTLTTQSGTFSDGSGIDKYSNNTNCSWLIQPASASSITLSFSAFDTEFNFDGVIVYDGSNNTAPILGMFTGTTIPTPVSSTGGSMYVSFLSDEALRGNGWNANYSSTALGIDEFYFNNKLKIYPNPTNGVFTIQSFFDNSITGEIFDVSGKQVLKSISINNGINTIDIADLTKGIYLLKVNDLNETKTIKVIKQ